MQSRVGSLVESLLNIGSGFFLAMLVWQFIVGPLYGIPVTLSQNLGITSIFTVVSVTRSYVWRRLFNGITHKKLQNKNKNQETSHEAGEDRDPRRGGGG